VGFERLNLHVATCYKYFKCSATKPVVELVCYTRDPDILPISNFLTITQSSSTVM